MKTEEDEAFDEIARKQGMWGGGFMAKRAMAADKLQEDRIKYGTSWEKDGERIDPMSVYKEPVTKREALKLALEALDSKNFDNCDAWCNERDQAITAIKEALAQPAQEPVAWRVKVQTKLRDGSLVIGYQLRNEKMSTYDEPLYTAHNIGAKP